MNIATDAYAQVATKKTALDPITLGGGLWPAGESPRLAGRR